MSNFVNVQTIQESTFLRHRNTFFLKIFIDVVFTDRNKKDIAVLLTFKYNPIVPGH